MTTQCLLHSPYKLHEALDHKAVTDHEFKRDYKELAEGCEEFAVSLLEQCRTMDEIKVLTDVCPDIVSLDQYSTEAAYTGVPSDTDEAKELTFLNMALRNRCDKVDTCNRCCLFISCFKMEMSCKNNKLMHQSFQSAFLIPPG